MIGRATSRVVSAARDALARGLVRVGVTPNTLTLTGMVLTAGAGLCYALGAASRFALSFDPSAPANAYLLVAWVLLMLAVKELVVALA